jgi:hypothetical protein
MNRKKSGSQRGEIAIMKHARRVFARTLPWCVAVLGAVALTTAARADGGGNNGEGPDATNMRWVGHADLQGRPAYEPTVIQQGNRFILYVGHHQATLLNPLTGQNEPDGVSIVDVTDPKHPKQLFHIPGREGQDSSMVRACPGPTFQNGVRVSGLPQGTPGHTYILRANGQLEHDIWDTTDPSHPQKIGVVVTGLQRTHKNWWECDTGIAYLVVNKPSEANWHTGQHLKIFDLSNPNDPTKWKYIRDYGLLGQNPQTQVPITPYTQATVHGPISVPEKNRVYLPNGVGSNGSIQIVDRAKLLDTSHLAPGEALNPTDAEILAPQISVINMSPDQGGHTAFPVYGIPQPEYSGFDAGKTRDVLVVTSEATSNFCQEAPHFGFLMDITDDAHPWPLSTLRVNDEDGHPDFCERGPRFGTHAANENFYPPYYGKLTFISYFDAGVRVWDIRDPVHPRQVAHFIPPVNANVVTSCNDTNTVCRTDISTNNVELDTRNLVYIVDRIGGGADILELTGEAKEIGEGKSGHVDADEHHGHDHDDHDSNR